MKWFDCGLAVLVWLDRLRKKDTSSNAYVFFRILRNFQEHLFYRAPPDNRFYPWQITFYIHLNNIRLIFCLTSKLITIFIANGYFWKYFTKKNSLSFQFYFFRLLRKQNCRKSLQSYMETSVINFILDKIGEIFLKKIV